MVSSVKLYVHQVVVTRQYIPSDAVLVEINASYIIIFVENILIVKFDEWFQQRTNPSHKG